MLSEAFSPIGEGNADAWLGLAVPPCLQWSLLFSLLLFLIFFLLNLSLRFTHVSYHRTEVHSLTVPIFKLLRCGGQVQMWSDHLVAAGDDLETLLF